MLKAKDCVRGVAYRSWREHHVRYHTDSGLNAYTVPRGRVADGGELSVRVAAGNYVLDSLPVEDEPTEDQFTPAELVQLDGGWSSS